MRDETGATKFFFIDPISGIIKTTRSLENVREDDVPFRLVVQARDNPSAPADESKTAEAHVVVCGRFSFTSVRECVVKCEFFSQINLIDDRHRMILVINDARPDVVKNDEDKIISVLEEHAKLIIGIEKITPRHSRRADNISLESDPNSTDLWFYAIDPDNEVILERNNSRVTR